MNAIHQDHTFHFIKHKYSLKHEVIICRWSNVLRSAFRESLQNWSGVTWTRRLMDSIPGVKGHSDLSRVWSNWDWLAGTIEQGVGSRSASFHKGFLLNVWKCDWDQIGDDVCWGQHNGESDFLSFEVSVTMTFCYRRPCSQSLYQSDTDDRYMVYYIYICNHSTIKKHRTMSYLRLCTKTRVWLWFTSSAALTLNEKWSSTNK